MEFMVTAKGNEQPRWVLAVDPVGERLLLALDDKTLQWVPMADYIFAAAATPDRPRPVIAVKPQAPGPQLAVPRIVGGNHGGN